MRRSKLDGFTFLKVLVIGFMRHPRASLNQLSQISEGLGVTISPQGIDERINAAAVVFLQERLAAILAKLENKRQRVMESLSGFSEIYIQDSTVISLSEGLQTIFPGVGGKASEAAIKIQLLFGFMQGQIAHWCLKNGRSADQIYHEHSAHLLPGSLLIQDLGYFSIPIFQQVVKRSAFFLTRWRQGAQLYRLTDLNHPIYLPDLLAEQEPEVAEYDVQLGEQTCISARMICVRLPTQVAEERRRRVRQDAIRKGRNVSHRTLALCNWNIFLTNLPLERLSLHQILMCYSLRWQIELIFKLWKSQAAINRLAGFRKERILVELYAKMIGLVLTHFLTAPLRFIFLDQLIEISLPKARQILQDRIILFAGFIGLNLSALQEAIGTLVTSISRFARKTRRSKHLSSLQRLRFADQLSISQLYS